jgi:hypothetical protein
MAEKMASELVVGDVFTDQDCTFRVVEVRPRSIFPGRVAVRLQDVFNPSYVNIYWLTDDFKYTLVTAKRELQRRVPKGRCTRELAALLADQHRV